MKSNKICEAIFVHKEEYRITLSELKEVSGLRIEEIQELVEFGVLEPDGEDPSNWLFTSHSLTIARRAFKLKRDFDLKPAGIALALTYRDRIYELEKRIRELECHLFKP